jgi:MFS family permease
VGRLRPSTGTSHRGNLGRIDAVLTSQIHDGSRVGRWFIARYWLAYWSTSLLFLAPALVTLALKVDDLVGSEAAPRSLAMVTGLGAVVAMVGNPVFGRLSDRTTSRWGMRRPWMVAGLVGGTAGIVIVALAPDIRVVLVGWCTAQLMFNAILAAVVAVLPDQVPGVQRGQISGLLGVCLPAAAVSGTFLVQLFAGNQLAMFLAPCGVSAAFLLLFVVTLKDRRLGTRPAPWGPRELASTFYVSPRTSPDFAWAFASRFMFVMAYAFLVTYQAYYLITQLDTPEGEVPHQIFVSTLVQSVALVVASLTAGRLSDRTGRRKVFVVTAAVGYGVALLVIAAAGSMNVFLAGMALSGLGFGAYMGVDLALVVDVLPDPGTVAKDLGVLNIAGALPFAVAPAVAPAILALSGGTYGALYAVAGLCAFAGAVTVLPIRGVR